MPLHPGDGFRLHTRQDGESTAVIGKTTVMTAVGVAPNLQVTPTQLISARLLEPRQWVISIMQAVQQVRIPSPWLSSFDGTATNPDNTLGAGRNFSAPTFPVGPSLGDAILQVTLNWGAGGAKFDTAFDYPIGGRMFGLTADQVDLSVGIKGATTTVYADPSLLPVVGAFMVEGTVTDPIPLRWTEPPATINGNAMGALSANWAVKPYSRKLHLGLSNAADTRLVTFSNAAGTVVWQRTLRAAEGVDFVFDVPAQAAFVNIENDSATAVGVRLEWQIGLT